MTDKDGFRIYGHTLLDTGSLSDWHELFYCIKAPEHTVKGDPHPFSASVEAFEFHLYFQSQILGSRSTGIWNSGCPQVKTQSCCV